MRTAVFVTFVVAFLQSANGASGQAGDRPGTLENGASRGGGSQGGWAPEADRSPISVQRGWLTFKNIETKDDFKVFRRYAYMGPAAGFPNLLMFNCSKNPNKAASHLTIVLPKDFTPRSFSRDSWFPKIDVRFLIDSRLSVSMPGEYIKGELFFDLNMETRNSFDKLLTADSLALSFGEKGDMIEFQFTPDLDEVFASFFKEPSQVSRLGRLTAYPRSGAGSLSDACSDYQHGASL